MNKLTAEIARRDIAQLREINANPLLNISMREEKYLAALEIALPVLEQQGGWISCSERMPPDAVMVLLRCNNDYDFGMLICGEMKVFSMGEWKIIPGASITHWQPLPAPPQPQPSTNPQIDNDGWIEWHGGNCPVERETTVDVKFRRWGMESPKKARCHFWGHVEGDFDIIAYRVIENDGREG